MNHAPEIEAWRYAPLAIALHWLLATLIVAMTGLGWTMMALEDDPGSAWMFGLHKSVGLVIAALVVVRLLWRSMHRPQPLAASLPKWQRQLAGATQAALYLAMVALPTLGYLGASYSKRGVDWFGIATPRWALPDHATAEWFFGAHAIGAWVLAALVGLHVAGALKHLWWDRDQAFQRMLLPRRR